MSRFRKTCSLLLLIVASLTAQLAAQQNTSHNFLLRTDKSETKIVDDNSQYFVSSSEEIAKPQEITLTTLTGIKVPSLFYDRGSSVALIAGQGLPAPKESMRAYAELFDSYDVILFDYRWHNKYGSSLAKSIVVGKPTQRILLDEEEEVRAVLHFLSQHKKYKKVIGLGICYSNFLFAKVQSDDTQKNGTGPFTHLIFDSCWYDLKSFAQSIAQDPYLPARPQKGGAPWLLKKITDSPIIKWPTLKVIFSLLTNVSVTEHLQKIATPILFIHGQEDLMVPKKDFEALWQAAQSENRAALLTPFRHADNLKNKYVYKSVVEQFVNSHNLGEFVNKIEYKKK